MATPYDILCARFQDAFDLLEKGADPVVRTSERSDYQVNGVMSVAKRLGRPPREVAEEILRSVNIADVATVDVAGPGFLNVTLTTEFLSAQVHQLLADPRMGARRSTTARRVVIDYSAPNVAKEMHVGHLRSTVIGDALRRMYEFHGDVVIARNHIGDWGTPFGMLIEHLCDLGEESALASLSMGDLNSFYREARIKFDGDDTFKDRSRTRVVALQGGDEETRRLWQLLVNQSVEYFSQVYGTLDVLLTADEAVGESYYNDMLHAVVEDLDTAGLLVESNGAQCVFPPGFVNREGEPFPLIVKKSDEGFGYAATDLAAVRDRVAHVHADEILYVVGAPQSQHLEMVYATARLSGWLPATVRCEHVAFGNVLGTDRKMFKTRSGDTVKLSDLVSEAVDRADAQLVERATPLDEAERRALAVTIARAAIKYADLSTERQRDYVFDLDRMLAFEGDTGPYLCYAHARIRSIFRRLDAPWTAPETLAVTDAAARHLLLGIVNFPEAVSESLALLAPHRLCTYLFDLAQRFTSFYESCPVLSAEEPLRSERLALCELTARTLAVGLHLLGIDAPERM